MRRIRVTPLVPNQLKIKRFDLYRQCKKRDMACGELQRVDALIAQKAIRAPFAGVTGIARVHLGQYLGAGEAITNLIDASTLHVNFALAEQALGQITIGHPVEVAVDAWPQQRFAGSISAIDPLVTATRTVQLQAHIPNPEGQLHAGMFANVRVLLAEQAAVLTVPETAVTYSAWGQTVFVAEADAAGVLRVRRMLVTVGQRWPGRMEIESGLSAGQEVVVFGQIKLSDGMQVLAAQAASTP